MAINAGDEIVAADLSPGEWIALDLQNGWQARSGFYTPACRQFGDRVELTGGLINGTTTDGTQIGTLPSGYRPASESPIPMLTNAGETVGLIVRPNGGMDINSSSTTSSFTSLYLYGFFLLEA